MRRIALLVAGSAVVIAALVALRPALRSQPDRPVAQAPPSTPTVGTSSATPTLPSYRNGSALGQLVHTPYGDAQVRATARHGRIVAVEAVRLPDNDPMDVRISRPAARELEQAVLTAQTVGVDMVAGATYTSEGYLRSLQSALDQLTG